MTTKYDAVQLETINQALRELESSIYNPRSVKYAYMELDTIASALRALLLDSAEDMEETPAETFQKLVASHGLADSTVDAAEILQELSSIKWYGLPADESDELLENAESCREELWQALSDFVEQFEEEEEEEEEEG